MRAKPFVAVMILTGMTVFSCAKKENNETDLASISKVASSDAELPPCTNELISQVYWVEEGSKFVICNGSKYVEIKGEQGDKGETGDKGESGSKGETGPAGSPANSGIWVFDADGKALGVLVDVDRSLVLLSNGGLTRINFATGAYAYGVAMDAQGGLLQSPTKQVECFFTEADCSGTCYQIKYDGVDKTIKGTVYYAGSSYYQSTGAETLVAGAVMKSSINVASGMCANFADSPIDAYPITKLYSLPDGVSFPLKTPLSFGFKTEE
jgi:hypothetical protein